MAARTPLNNFNNIQQQQLGPMQFQQQHPEAQNPPPINQMHQFQPMQNPHQVPQQQMMQHPQQNMQGFQKNVPNQPYQQQQVQNQIPNQINNPHMQIKNQVPDFLTTSLTDGLRLSWNLWPHPPLSSLQNKTGAQLAAQVFQGPSGSNSLINSIFSGLPSSSLAALTPGNEKLPLPISALYTPAADLDLSRRPPNSFELKSQPQICSNNLCRAILNPFCKHDPASKSWYCCFCRARNDFAPSYDYFLQQNMIPPEMNGACTTVEYLCPSQSPSPIFVFLIDMAVTEEEFNAIKQSIIFICNTLPENSMVGLISFGSIVRLHELYEKFDFLKMNAFCGNKKISKEAIRKLIETQIAPAQKEKAASDFAQSADLSENCFFAKFSNCDLEFMNILNCMSQDYYQPPISKRTRRCFDVALEFAVSLLENLYPNKASRIVSFIGGPITYGPAAIAYEEKSSEIRQFSDINNNRTPLLGASLKFFSEVAIRAAKNSTVIDVYTGFPDQVGLYELKYAALLTGGVQMIADSFNSTSLRQTLIKNFTPNANGAEYAYYNKGMLEVKCSPGLKIMGCIGPCSSLNTQSPSVSNKRVALSNTVRWKINALTKKSTFSFLFESPNDVESVQAILNNNSMGYIQFITSSYVSETQRKLRVTTVCRSWMEVDGSFQNICKGFDESAAVVVASKFAVYAAEFEDNPDCIKWLDKILILLVKSIASYTPNNPASVSLPKNFQMLPQFMFHFRRSNLMNIFNLSPDESTFYRHIFLRSNMEDTLTMIQPILLSFSFKGHHPVLLDFASIRHDNILVLDTYFMILIHHGETIHKWVQNEIDKREDQYILRNLLQYAQEKALQLLKSRNPTPRFVQTHHNGSQARFLLSKVNPSRNHNNTYSSGEKALLTDDISLQSFIDSLKRLVVVDTSK